MIKAYTDLIQSKILAEILSHKTADNTYERVVISGCNLGMPEEKQYVHRDIPFTYFSGIGVPCWSLAALLSVLPYKIKLSHDVIDVNGNSAYKNECYKFSINRCGLFGDKWNVQYYGKHERQLGKRYKELYIDLLLTENYNNPIDACFEMIIKLYEQKIL